MSSSERGGRESGRVGINLWHRGSVLPAARLFVPLRARVKESLGGHLKVKYATPLVSRSGSRPDVEASRPRGGATADLHPPRDASSPLRPPPLSGPGLAATRPHFYRHLSASWSVVRFGRCEIEIRRVH